MNRSFQLFHISLPVNKPLALSCMYLSVFMKMKNRGNIWLGLDESLKYLARSSQATRVFADIITRSLVDAEDDEDLLLFLLLGL